MPAEVEIFLEGKEHPDLKDHRTCIRGIVETIDISLGGFSAKILHSPMDTEKSFSPAMAYALVDREIVVFFKGFEITVWGKVVRVDPMTMLMAVIITRISNISSWRKLCRGTSCAGTSR